MDIRPIKLKPSCKNYIWGGTRLKDEYGKGAELEKVAESWELSVHKDGESIVSGGDFDQTSLSSYIENNGRECLGSNALNFEFFPILIKLIDAQDSLSVQVHPSDDYALKYEGEFGKTEMWYIVDAKPGAFIYYGFKREITKDEFRKRIENNTVLEVLNKVDIKKGDVFFIQSGTIHAIGKGSFICEVQQNSNKTYRVYDYDRRDKNGNARELHIEKALEVTNLSPAIKEEPTADGVLARCKYFTAEKVECHGKTVIDIDEMSFRSLIVLTGKGTLAAGGVTLGIGMGDSIFVPAQNGKILIEGNCEIIVSYV